MNFSWKTKEETEVQRGWVLSHGHKVMETELGPEFRSLTDRQSSYHCTMLTYLYISYIPYISRTCTFGLVQQGSKIVPSSSLVLNTRWLEFFFFLCCFLLPKCFRPRSSVKTNFIVSCFMFCFIYFVYWKSIKTNIVNDK